MESPQPIPPPEAHVQGVTLAKAPPVALEMREKHELRHLGVDAAAGRLRRGHPKLGLQGCHERASPPKPEGARDGAVGNVGGTMGRLTAISTLGSVAGTMLFSASTIAFAMRSATGVAAEKSPAVRGLRCVRQSPFQAYFVLGIASLAPRKSSSLHWRLGVHFAA